MNNNFKEKLIFFLYARKSSDSEDRQVQSIEDQINALKKLAQTQNIEIKEIFTESKTAKEPHCRAVFIQMVKRLEKGEANGVLCWEINRLYRNPVDQGTINWMLQRETIQCIQTIDKCYLPSDNVLLLGIEGAMANQYIIDLRKNCMRGMIGKAERGWFPSYAPIGYINNKTDNIISEDTERFQLVRRMWDLMLTGNYTPPQILEIANEKWGLLTPKHKRTGNKKLSRSFIYKIFTNIFYTGMFVWVGTLYKGNHKPMITMEEFDKVQMILGKKGKPRHQVHNFAFTGIIRCATCGSMITATEKTKLLLSTGQFKKYVYYHCTRKNKSILCNERPLTLDEFEFQIEKELEKYTLLPEFKEWIFKAIDDVKAKENNDIVNIHKTQSETLHKAENEIAGLIRMRYKNMIDDEMFNKEKEELQNTITKLKDQLTATENNYEKWIELTEKAFHFSLYSKASFNFCTPEEKKEIFSCLGSNYKIKDKKLLFDGAEWLIPIEKAHFELEAKYKRLELEKRVSAQAFNDAFTLLCLQVWRVVDDVRTAFVKKNDTSIKIPLLKQP